MGKLLIIVGILLIVAGLIITFFPRFPLPGKLPGDITVEKENFKLFLPITSSIIISILLSLIFYFINRYKNWQCYTGTCANSLNRRLRLSLFELYLRISRFQFFLWRRLDDIFSCVCCFLLFGQQHSKPWLPSRLVFPIAFALFLKTRRTLTRP